MRKRKKETLQLRCIPAPCVITLVEDINQAIAIGSERDKAEAVRKIQARYRSVEIENYRQYVEAAGMNSRSVRLCAHLLHLLLVAAGDRPVRNIRACHLAKFEIVYRYWPKSYTRRKGFEYLSDARILAPGMTAGAEPRSSAQMLLATTYLRYFFAWLCNSGALVRSPNVPRHGGKAR